MSNPLLAIEHLDVYRGESHILHDLSLSVNHGECVAIIGSNGAGKSTLIESVMGFLPPRNGTINFDKMSIHAIPPNQIFQYGISWVPEGRRLFGDMTVLENIELGMKNTATEQQLEKVYSLFPTLKSRLHQFASTLSGGEQQMVALARALASKPRLLLIDEMSIGLSPKYTQDVFFVLDEIRKTGMSVLIVEQNAAMALRHSDRAYIIEQGTIVLKGGSQDLLTSPQIRTAYLGLT